MSEAYLVQQPIQIWNSVRGVWEKPMASLLCEHWELFSEAWQISGMMRNGQVFALPMPAHLTADSGFSSQQQDNLPTPKARDSQPEGYEAGLRRATPQVGTIVKGLVDGDERVLLRSPKASEGQGGALGEAEAIKRGNTVGVRDQIMDLVASQGMKVSRTQINEDSLLPTPNTMEHREIKTPEQIAALKEKSPGGYRNLREEVINNLPTPTTRDYKDGTAEHERDGVVQTDTVARAIFNSGEILLPTTRVSMANGATSKEIEAGNPKSRIETEVMLGEVSWGKFEPAIRRWEAVMDRPAPAPTLPDGKDGAHRLSPWFTEWMMGLPEGWICDPEIGLTRNEQLKACGNGVVPQQAELALRILLEGIDFSGATNQVNLPTPTVSDTFTSNLKSTQQKEGSMHSVTLPQAVERLVENCG